MRHAWLVPLALSVVCINATELTFELAHSEQQCFYEDLDQGVKFDIDFQVIAGGNYDVNCSVTDPVNNVLYEEQKKQYDSVSYTTAIKGVHKVCFSNEFSTFSHKTVYVDFRTGEERPLPVMTIGIVSTQMDLATMSIHKILKVVSDYQTWYRLQKAQDRTRAEDFNVCVFYWSIGKIIILLVVSIGQVLMLKSFFNDKKNSPEHITYLPALLFSQR